MPSPLSKEISEDPYVFITADIEKSLFLQTPALFLSFNFLKYYCLFYGCQTNACYDLRL
jgi:hypothetical protein